MAKNRISDFKYTPTNGWLDREAFPTYYFDEDHVRRTFHELFNQVRDYENHTLNTALASESKNSEGASLIGMSELFSGDTSGPSVADKLLSLRADFENISNLNIPDNSLTADKLQNGSVGTDKLADNAVTEEKLDGNLFYDIASSTAAAKDSAYNFAGMLIGLEKASLDTAFIPKKKLVYDSFKDTTKTDTQNSFLSETASGITTRQPQAIQPHESSASARETSFGDCELCCIICPDKDGMNLDGITFDIRSVPVSITAELIVKNVSSGLPGETILASGTPITPVKGSNTLTLTSALELTKNDNYALCIKFTSTTEYAVSVDISTHTLSGGMFVSSLKGTVSNGITSWSSSKFPTSLRLNISWSGPSVYVSIPQSLTDDVKTASLYIRKTPNMTVQPHIAMYKGASPSPFSEMTKDASYIPYDFGEGITEEKWDYVSSDEANTAKIKLIISGESDSSQYISAYSAVFR